MKPTGPNGKGGVMPVLIIIGAVLFLPMLVLNPVLIFVIVAIAAAILVFNGVVKKESGGQKTSQPSQKAPKTVSEPCTNPEPHRHFESPAPQVSPSAAPKLMTQSEQDDAARKKRLENMRVLYDAGILTREEYDYEVRRLKKS